MGNEIGRFDEEVDEELICCICSRVLDDPLQVPHCTHAFCAGCINEWLTYQPTCPVDRSLVTFHLLKPDLASQGTCWLILGSDVTSPLMVVLPYWVWRIFHPTYWNVTSIRRSRCLALKAAVLSFPRMNCRITIVWKSCETLSAVSNKRCLKCKVKLSKPCCSWQTRSMNF